MYRAAGGSPRGEVTVSQLPLGPMRAEPGGLRSMASVAELLGRPSRPPDYEADSRALLALAQSMAEAPEGILQKVAETALDTVLGSLKTTGDPLPRMPPFRFRGGLRYQRNAFQAGGDWTWVGGQDRVFGEETPTDGYNLAKLFASYAFTRGRLLHAVTARLENVTDELYRNHLSFIKELAPEIGRNFKLLYNVKF